MDPAAESLARAILHDLANTLSGVRGVVDLSRGLTALEQARLDSLISEGFTVMERARHLVLGTQPESGPEAGESWRKALEVQAEPMALAFHCPIRVAYEGDPGRDQWPGELLRSWVLAGTRQVLPYIAGSREQGITLATTAQATHWEVVWGPVTHFPSSFQPGADLPRDIASRWVREVGSALGIQVTQEGDRIKARIPRF